MKSLLPKAVAGNRHSVLCGSGERAYGQARIRSLLIRSVGLVGRLENKSTDHKEGIAPVPLWVRPESRRPGWDYRSPIIADNLQMTTHGSVQPSR